MTRNDWMLGIVIIVSMAILAMGLMNRNEVLTNRQIYIETMKNGGKLPADVKGK